MCNHKNTDCYKPQEFHIVLIKRLSKSSDTFWAFFLAKMEIKLVSFVKWKILLNFEIEFSIFPVYLNYIKQFLVA